MALMLVGDISVSICLEWWLIPAPALPCPPALGFARASATGEKALT